MKRLIKASDSIPADENLWKAIDLINEYYYYEFYGQYGDDLDAYAPYEGNEITPEDDLSDIGLMFTTGPDQEELQTSVDLINCKMNYYVDGKLVHTDDYANLEDLITKQLKHIDWDDMYNTCMKYI